MDIANLKVANLENVELKVDSTSKTKFVFPDIETLRGKKIVGIAIPKVANVSNAPLGSALVNDTVNKKSYLVLNVNGKEKVNRMPLPMLDPASNGGNVVIFNSLIVDWPKSSIEVATTASLSTSEVFFMVVYYID